MALINSQRFGFPPKTSLIFLVFNCLFMWLPGAMAQSADAVLKANAAAEKVRTEKLAILRSAAGAEGGVGRWADAIIKTLRPLIVFNPTLYSGARKAVFLIKLDTDGRILVWELLSTSGDQNWDKAASDALGRAEYLPKNDQGLIPTKEVKISFDARDNL